MSRAQSRRRGVAAVLSGGCVAALLATGAAPASAAVAPESPARVPAQFPITVDTTVPAGGQAWVGSPSLPSTGRRIVVRVAPNGGGAATSFAAMYTVLATMSNRDRLLTCSMYGSLALTQADALATMNEPTAGLATLADSQGAMRTCFQIVRFLTAHRSRGAAPAPRTGAACPGMTVSIPVSSTGTGDTATIAIAGAAAVPRRPALKVTCTASGAAMSLAVSTRGKRTPLRRVVGDRLTIGFASAPTSTTAIPLTLTFGRPR